MAKNFLLPSFWAELVLPDGYNLNVVIKYVWVENTRPSFLPEDHKPRLWRLLRVRPIVVSVSHAAPFILEEREQREQSRIAFEHESEDLYGKAFQVRFYDSPSLG